MRTLVFVGAILGGLCLLASFFVNGAPQEAALAATACALAIIPYVIFRAIQLEREELNSKVFREQMSKRIAELIEAQQQKS